MWSNRNRSFLPRLLGNDYWDLFDYPTDIYNQDFGLDVFDQPRLGYGGGYGGGNQLMPFDYGNQNYPVQGRQGFSNVQNDQNKFAVNLDCKQFKPDEVNVTVDEQNNQLLIHGRHEERSDDHGHISREFKRRYALPKETQLDKINCNWDNNGVLSIEVPKQPQQPQLTDQGRRIPIQMRGQQQQGQLQHQGQFQPGQTTGQFQQGQTTRQFQHDQSTGQFQQGQQQQGQHHPIHQAQPTSAKHDTQKAKPAQAATRG